MTSHSSVCQIVRKGTGERAARPLTYVTHEAVFAPIFVQGFQDIAWYGLFAPVTFRPVQFEITGFTVRVALVHSEWLGQNFCFTRSFGSLVFGIDERIATISAEEV